jgi:hypothetical protein
MQYYLDSTTKAIIGKEGDMSQEKETVDLSAINLSEWYSASAAAERLSRNSGKDIKPSYPRKLAEYGKIRSIKISDRSSLYYKPDVDSYIVEERGEKSGRAKRQSAKPKTRKPSEDNAA